MNDEFLRTAEFERWAEQFDRRLEPIKNLAEVQAAHGRDIAVLKDRADHSPSRGAAGAISALVASVISGIISALQGGR